MLMDLKPWLCPEPGSEYDNAEPFGKLRLGLERLFWKCGLRRYAVRMEHGARAYRQIEHVYGKLCCGGRSYDIHRLVLVLRDGKTLTLHIGDDEKKAAEELLNAISERFAHIAIGK